MEPRILQSESVSQLTLWGLRGLTALDPDILVMVHDDRLFLTSRNRLIADQALTADGDVTGWADTAVALATLAMPISGPIRRAGTQGIVQSFFDELFNHLDPYSRYVSPRDAAEERARRTGEAGAGLRLVQRNATIVVAAAIIDGPGAVAGIRPGDTILAVDGEPVRGSDADKVSARIAGPEDTTVTITWRGRDGRVRSTELERVLVPPETVVPQRVSDMLIVQITAFDRSTGVHLAHAIQDGLTGSHPPDGIVVDLRGNRGGLLRQAVSAADELLSPGIVAVTAGRDPEANEIWRSTTGELAENMPVVVLVDGRTASAAEFLAAALADRGRGVVVGSATLGKGLVQTIAPLPDGGELFVTWSRVLAPRGWPIQGLGVLPQVCTSLGQNALATQLAALAEGQQPMAQALIIHRSARAPVPPAQVLAIRSACPAAEGNEADLEAARVLIRNPAAYAAALLPPLRETGSLSLSSGDRGDH